MGSRTDGRVGPKIHHQQIFIQITGIISFQRLPPGGAEVLLETFILIEKNYCKKCLRSKNTTDFYKEPTRG